MRRLRPAATRLAALPAVVLAVVLAAVLAVVLTACDPSAPSTPTATASAPSVARTSSAPVALPQSVRVGEGLRTFLTAHPLKAGKSDFPLKTCPYGSVRSFADRVNAVGGDVKGYDLAQAVVQRYELRRPNDGALGDHGLALSCTARVGERTILGLTASTNSRPIPTGKVKGLRGPEPYRDGSTYTKNNKTDLCSVYWVPPGRDYVLTVVFRTERAPTAKTCRNGFTVAAPPIIDALAAHAG